MSNPGPIGVLVRTAGKTAVLAGFAVLGWTVDRHALWGAVGVALAGASLILCGAALLRRALRAAALRARLHGVSLADLDGLPGAGFEDWVVRCLDRSGFRCEPLPRTRDFGIDLVAVRSRRRIGIQAKRYEGPVGNGAVQQAIAGAGHHGCDLAVVVTQSRFTEAARTQAARATPPVVLVDRDGLADLGRRLRRAL